MRHYALTMSSAHSPRNILEYVALWRRNWRSRKVFRELLSLADCHLVDVGFTRGQLNHLLRLPLTVDLDWEAERLRLVNAKGRWHDASD